MADRLLTVDQLINELSKYSHKELHMHHTWKPSHKDFNGKNYQERQDAMRRFHVNTCKFNDIAQHVTLFPDGKFLTGRNFSKTPASITGYNTGGFCVEMLGNFDKGNDKFQGVQKAAMLKLAKYFNSKKRYIRFHNENSNKSCPGTSIDKAVFMNEVRNYVDPSKPLAKTKTAVKAVVNKVKTVVKPKYPGYLIKIGHTGTNVKKIQKALGIKQDGIFGKQTLAAVKAFQLKNGLSVDGLVGGKTWSKMF